MEIGKSTTQNVSEVLQQANIILALFSLLAILAALFLIGEVMFLNVIQKKKDLAIMKCYGASSLDMIKIVFYESLQILIIAQGLCLVLYYQIIQIINHFIQGFFEGQMFFVGMDWKIVCIVFMLCTLLVLISQCPPLLYILKMNTVAALKE